MTARCKLEDDRSTPERGREPAIQINFDPNSETLDDDYEVFHKHKKSLPEAEAKAIEERFQTTFAKQREEVRRWTNDRFMFWLVCEHRACKRNEGCAGDPYACHARWWPFVPERYKVRHRAIVAARAEGRSVEEALAHAEAEVSRLADHIAYIEAQQDALIEALAAAERGKEAPHPAAFGRGGEREERKSPRVRAL